MTRSDLGKKPILTEEKVEELYQQIKEAAEAWVLAVNSASGAARFVSSYHYRVALDLQAKAHEAFLDKLQQLKTLVGGDNNDPL